MNHDAIARNFGQIAAGIHTCFGQRLIAPSLILLYCSIDVAGWLWARQDSTPVARRFIEWTEKYLLPGSALKCRAVDLFGARCGLVHTLSASSDLSAAAKARKVIYAWGNSRVETLQEMTRFGDLQRSYVAVQLEDLIVAFGRGLDRFLADLQKNPKRAARAYSRAEQFFTNMSEEEGQGTLRWAQELLGRRPPGSRDRR